MQYEGESSQKSVIITGTLNIGTGYMTAVKLLRVFTRPIEESLCCSFSTRPALVGHELSRVSPPPPVGVDHL